MVAMRAMLNVEFRPGPAGGVRGWVSAVVLVLASLVAPGVAQAEMTVWYRKPADFSERAPTNGWSNSRGWVEALPVGNGRLGAMIYGGTAVERLQLIAVA